jgi:hypothetical protein
MVESWMVESWMLESRMIESRMVDPVCLRPQQVDQKQRGLQVLILRPAIPGHSIAMHEITRFRA